MPYEVKMPQLSDTMHSGKILAWRKKEGESVRRGEILAEVETDKANLEIEAFHEGLLLQIAVPAGIAADVGQTIAYIGQAGETIASGSVAPVESRPATVEAAQPRPGVSAADPSPAAASTERIKASPLARKLAEEHHIDLSGVKGSGPQGRIIKKDLEEAERSGDTAVRSPSPIRPVSGRTSDTPQAGGAPQTYPLSRMRETIARRMQQSMSESPHFYSTVSVNMREALKLREALKEEEGFKGLTVNHLIIKASAWALRREPRVNCAMRDGLVYQPGDINIGIVTAVEDGLLIPVIRDADKLPLPDLVFEARAAVERARAGRPNSTDLNGGTFSISNMGMLEVENFTAIINPGQGAILAVSAVRETPIVENSVVLAAPVMKVTLSVDHRVIDGVMAANFLKFFKRALEIPALLLT